jgi:hypothetical protein
MWSVNKEQQMKEMRGENKEQQAKEMRRENNKRTFEGAFLCILYCP